ncbi:hypothetical protein [Curtobacterium sp. ISL-83]|uniref:hypothetical protein n=1 Tax=Curtobacterium sp. ISL-83 TaxID=2819145 RepID=UPI001BEB1F73|nr:hypothetical protein [Curtobacterium sp. ISL-83]MBT2502098.1 hypothetical protein [Curtobacterium sp. ISL-83]
MSAALNLTEVGPIERAAHRVGTALLRWSEARAARGTLSAVGAPVGSARVAARLALEQDTALEARQRHWDQLAAATPRLR